MTTPQKRDYFKYSRFHSWYFATVSNFSDYKHRCCQ